MVKRNNLAGKKVILGCRPEHFKENGSLKFTNDMLEHMGPSTLFHTHIGGTNMTIKLPGWLDYNDGDVLSLDINQDVCCFFDEETTNRIR